MSNRRLDSNALPQALGQSEAFLTLQEQISRAAKTERPVILIGERGTGKELAAARLHLLSARWNQPYVTLNCASLTPTLIESELFGHEAGAFTGAARLRKGRFEQANGGSMFLDEVANIPMTVQEKILRVVEYGNMERVGSSASMTVDVRLIAATNVDLRRMARAGRFRQDLLDRLSFEVITLPPLRERREDLPLLIRHFAGKMAQELGRGEIPEFTDGVMQRLLMHHWPGNIRELKNVVERMVYRSDGEIAEVVFDPFESAYAPLGTGHGSAPAVEPGMEPWGHGRHTGGGSAAAGSWGAAGAGGFGGGEDFEPGRNEPYAPGRGGGSGTEFGAVGTGVDRNGEQAAMDDLSLTEAVQQYEIRRIREALIAARYNQREASDALGLTYHQFRGYYRKYKDELLEEVGD